MKITDILVVAVSFFQLIVIAGQWVIYRRQTKIKRLHSIGFIYEIDDWEGARAARAPRIYTEQREEQSEPPAGISTGGAEVRHVMSRPATMPLLPPR